MAIGKNGNCFGPETDNKEKKTLDIFWGQNVHCVLSQKQPGRSTVSKRYHEIQDFRFFFFLSFLDIKPDTERVNTLFLTADVNYVSGERDGKLSVLHVACSNGHVGIAKLLLKRKADDTARDRRMMSPFHR